MLIATPYRDFDIRDKSPPRIISEIRKSYANCSLPNFRPKLTGEVLVKWGSGSLERRWRPCRASIRCGHLVVNVVTKSEDGPSTLRLPLRHLSLNAGPLPYSISLCRGANAVVTLQTSSQRAFDEWIKAIAIELIRQTPLDAIKYLDILSIAECWKRREDTYEKDWNCNSYAIQTRKNIPESCTTCVGHYQKNNHIAPIKTIAVPTASDEVVQEQNVKDLMKKCQNVENYVPVKEKLFLFESLCKLGRKVRSTEDVSLRIETNTKRARSLHDLSNLNSHIAVREICKYFENKTEIQQNPETKYNSKRLVNSDSHLNDLNKFRSILRTS